jgi:uncharacterized membrane protein YdjX (TVP38/TMEM64 family)
MRTAVKRIYGYGKKLWDHPVHWRVTLLHLAIFVAILAALIGLGYYWGEYIPQMEDFIGSLGIWGPVIFIALFIATMPFFVPNVPFALAAGALFGLWWGTVYIVIAGLAAELMLFTAGHRFLRGRVESWLAKHPKLLALRSALTEKPIRFMVLLRLSPIPFTPICYMLSTTRVSYRDYIIGYMGYIPGNFLTVYFGFVAKHVVKAAGGADDVSTWKIVLAVVTLIATVILVTYVSHAARKALKVQVERSKSAKHV